MLLSIYQVQSLVVKFVQVGPSLFYCTFVPWVCLVLSVLFLCLFYFCFKFPLLLLFILISVLYFIFNFIALQSPQSAFLFSLFFILHILFFFITFNILSLITLFKIFILFSSKLLIPFQLNLFCHLLFFLQLLI